MEETHLRQLCENKMLSEISLVLGCHKKWESKYWKDDRKTKCMDGKEDCLANKHKFFKPEN